jgi:guanylate kinase
MYPKKKLIIITAPSGAGKTSIVKKLMNTDLPLGFSVSACTRKQRAGEKNGKDYYFISTEDFLHKIANHEFAEFEEVYAGSYYGTLKSEIQRIWNEENKSVLFDIDVQGALRLKNNFGETALTIFIKPPSFEILVERLTQRNTESEESLKKRIDKASLELTFESKFDVVIENIVLEDAFMEAKNIIHKFLF